MEQTVAICYDYLSEITNEVDELESKLPCQQLDYINMFGGQ